MMLSPPALLCGTHQLPCFSYIMIRGDGRERERNLVKTLVDVVSLEAMRSPRENVARMTRLNVNEPCFVREMRVAAAPGRRCHSKRRRTGAAVRFWPGRFSSF
jgi:hypothetical protein